MSAITRPYAHRIPFRRKSPKSVQGPTCLSFNPNSRMSSINVSFGCLLLSLLSLRSLGSKAILWPFSLVKDVSGRRLSSEEPFLDMGEETLLSSFSSAPATRPPPLRRVKPPAEAMRIKVRDLSGVCIRPKKWVPLGSRGRQSGEVVKNPFRTEGGCVDRK